MRDNSDKEKNRGHKFFHEVRGFQDPSMDCSEDIADIKSVINGQNDRQAKSNMANQLFFKRLRHNKEKNKRLPI